MPEVVVDYCLDHFYHSGELYSFADVLALYEPRTVTVVELADPLEACKPVPDLFTPEVFMRELAARRERTQQLIQDTGLQRVKRRAQPPSLSWFFFVYLCFLCFLRSLSSQFSQSVFCYSAESIHNGEQK